jgi:hypothetical protein
MHTLHSTIYPACFTYIFKGMGFVLYGDLIQARESPEHDSFGGKLKQDPEIS